MVRGRVDLLLSFAGLGFPILLGLVVGAAGLFRDPATAIAVLNRYALYVGFPCLIAAGLTGEGFSLPLDVGFWLIVPIAAGFTAAIGGLLGKVRGLVGKGGVLALAGMFGNVAYIGLPLCERILGEQIVGLASLAVSVFIICSLLLGPTLLLAWTPGAAGGQSPILRAFRQPLLWSPFVGLALRLTPWMHGAHDLLVPVGRSAAPVALFLLGLYLFDKRASAVTLRPVALAQIMMKILIFPAIVTPMCLMALQAGLLQVDAAQVLILLSSTPMAIAVFAFAVEFDTGQDELAQGIVLTTLFSAITLPLVSAWVLTLG